MKNKEKALLKKNIIWILIVITVYNLIQFGCDKLMGDDFKDYLFTWEWQEQYNSMEPDQLRIEFENDDIVHLEDVHKEDEWIVYTLSPVHKGSTLMTVYDAQTGDELMQTVYTVSLTGHITDLTTGNFTNYRVHHLNMMLLCIALSIVLWWAFAQTQKQLRYSYQSIFYSGLALWTTLTAILMIRLWYIEEVMVTVYGLIQSAAGKFMLYTFLPMLAFCIALSVSNVSLIRHEGFRTRNALGIILSIVMILGAVLYWFTGLIDYSGSEHQMRLFNAGLSIYSSIYAFLECFLIGAIVCGTLAAKQEPAPDIDYVIILGCMVKPDGTLYPLIRGRVDRAIAFYHKQLAKTGKAPIFVPSGGQGSDETVSEAEAMKRYLLEQGIPEEHIMKEDQSKNTVQNMRFSKKLIEDQNPQAKTAFSTTNFHVFRSGIIARQNDFEPSGMGSPTKWYFWPNAYMREVVGMMVYKWKSMVLVLLPIIAFMIAIQFIG